MQQIARTGPQHATGTLTGAANALIETDELTPAARRPLTVLMHDLARWRAEVGSLPHAELARVILEESGYIPMLQAQRTSEAEGRLENLTELTRAMHEFDSLGSFLEHVSLVMENDANEAEEKVTIMTLHAAKGLEFDHVFLVGWEEGVFPSQRSLDEGGNASLEEERRLAYVGITRAKRQATISHAANRRIYGSWTSSIPSRFVGELPEDAVAVTNTMQGGASLWRAALSSGDPFADVARGQGRGPGWARASALGGASVPGRGGLQIDAKASAVSVGEPGRSDVALGARVFHSKFGYGAVTAIEGNKLEIDFEKAGAKRVLDSFVEVVAG